MADNANQPKEANEFIIQGVTSNGRPFRPSDWAERLCGVMSSFGGDGMRSPNAHLRYSPYVRPTLLEGIKSVVLSEELRKIEPMAYHFVLNFAKDNDLRIVEACVLPEPDKPA